MHEPNVPASFASIRWRHRLPFRRTAERTRDRVFARMFVFGASRNSRNPFTSAGFRPTLASFLPISAYAAQQSALHRVDAYSGGRFACEGRTSCSHSGTRGTPHARMSRRSLVVSLCRPPTGTRSSSRRGGAGARCRTRAERRHSAPGCRAREPFSCAGSVNPAPRQLRRMWPCRSGSDGQVLVASQYLRRLSLVS